jgi:hypothetical protein
VAILIRLGDAADVDAAVSVYEQSNLARRQGVWPDRKAGVERSKAHLRDPGSWFFLAEEGPASGSTGPAPSSSRRGSADAIPTGLPSGRSARSPALTLEVKPLAVAERPESFSHQASGAPVLPELDVADRLKQPDAAVQHEREK